MHCASSQPSKVDHAAWRKKIQRMTCNLLEFPEIVSRKMKSRKVPRHEIWCNVAIDAPHFSVRAKLYNLSTKGCAIALDGVTVWRGRTLSLSFDSEMNICAQVVWSNGPDAGLAFAREIDPGVISAIIGRSPPDEIANLRPRLFDRPLASSVVR